MSINRNSVLVSSAGGVLSIISGDGEYIAEVAIPAGRVSAGDYLDLVPEGGHLAASPTLTVIQRRHRVGIQPYGPGATDSAANPDFRPTSASRLEREMRVQLSRMQAVTKRVEAREKALAAIQRVPDAPAPASAPDEPVIEPVEEENSADE